MRHSLMPLPMLNSFFHSNGSFLVCGKVASLLVLCSHDILCHAGYKRCTPPMLVVLTSAAWCALQSVKKPPQIRPRYATAATSFGSLHSGAACRRCQGVAGTLGDLQNLFVGPVVRNQVGSSEKYEAAPKCQGHRASGGCARG